MSCDATRPSPVHVIVPHLGSSGNSRLEERIAAEREPAIASVGGTWLGRLPLVAIVPVASNGPADERTLEQAVDGYLVLPVR